MATSGDGVPSAPKDSVCSTSLGRCNAVEKQELKKMLVLACWHGLEEVVRKLAQKELDFRICNEKYDGSGTKEVCIYVQVICT